MKPLRIGSIMGHAMLRRLLAALAIVCLQHASPAHAATSPACSGEATEIPLAGAAITARRVANGLRWDARFIVSVDAANDFAGGTLSFAMALPAGETLEPTAGVRSMSEPSPADPARNRITRLCVSREALSGRTITVSFLQPTATPTEDGILGAPVVAGPVVHVVDGAASSDARLQLSPTTGLERHVGFVAPRGVGHDAREEARRLTGVEQHLTKNPIFVRGDDVRAASGLSGRFVDPRARTRENAIGVAVVFVAVVGILLLAARRLRTQATVERADAMLAAEIEAAATPRRRARTR